MNTEKIKALDQVSDALDEVEATREDETLTKAQKKTLEQTALTLRNSQRSIIKTIQLELIDSLTADSKALQKLSEEIVKSSDKLDKLANTIEKASKVVEAFVKVLVAAGSAGLL